MKYCTTSRILNVYKYCLLSTGYVLVQHIVAILSLHTQLKVSFVTLVGFACPAALRIRILPLV